MEEEHFFPLPRLQIVNTEQDNWISINNCKTIFFFYCYWGIRTRDLLHVSRRLNQWALTFAKNNETFNYYKQF